MKIAFYNGVFTLFFLVFALIDVSAQTNTFPGSVSVPDGKSYEFHSNNGAVWSSTKALLKGYDTQDYINILVPGSAANGAIIRLNANGNVGIGTATPRERLSVNGTVRAKEIKVETANWPDYVFEDNYQMQSLAEVETFIKTNGHLPGIPTAADVKENGVELGEMNRKLLEKVEELTLRLIEKEKVLDEVVKRVGKLEKNDRR